MSTTTPPTGAAPTDPAQLRGLHAKWSLEYGSAIWQMLKERAEQSVIEECAWCAWAHMEAFKADDPRAHFNRLHAARYGTEGRGPRLVVDNTRS